MMKGRSKPKGVAQHHLTWYLMKEPDMVWLLREGFHVNDYVSGALQKAKEMMNQGGFSFCK